MLEDKLEAFALGVDDYMTKPFELAELEARIVAMTRRKEKTIEQVLTHGDITVDIGKHKIYKKTREIDV
jgi:DNA-binding response OmpR family regulator